MKLTDADHNTVEEIANRVTMRDDLHRRNAVVSAVEHAILHERERAANVAETWGQTPPRPGGARDQIAEAIRLGPQ